MHGSVQDMVRSVNIFNVNIDDCKLKLNFMLEKQKWWCLKLPSKNNYECFLQAYLMSLKISVESEVPKLLCKSVSHSN